MPNGYGVMKRKKQTILVHRAAFELSSGKIAQGELICHTCDNKPCFNPKHLYVGNHRQNMEDAIERNVFDGKRGYAARLNDMQVRIIRRLYALGGWSYRGIGELFNISLGAIYEVVKRRTWKHI